MAILNANGLRDSVRTNDIADRRDVERPSAHG
jgi:hypothetical protein